MNTKTNSENLLRHCNEEQRQLWNTEHASRAWTSFKNRYISMHIDSPRWGLDALKETVCNQEDGERLNRLLAAQGTAEDVQMTIHRWGETSHLRPNFNDNSQGCQTHSIPSDKE